MKKLKCTLFLSLGLTFFSGSLFGATPATDWNRDLFDTWTRMSDAIIQNASRLSQSFLNYSSVEDEENYYYEVAIPGVSQGNVSVTATETILTIEGKAESLIPKSAWKDKQDKSINFSFKVPSAVAHEKIKAKIKNGLLLITLPKLKKDQKKIKIKVNAG